MQTFELIKFMLLWDRLKDFYFVAPDVGNVEGDRM